MFKAYHELEVDPEPCSRSILSCKTCEFLTTWQSIIYYNLVMGMISPVLWLVNCGLVSYALLCFDQDSLCDEESHLSSKALLYRLLGYTCALVAFAVAVACAAWAMVA